MQRYRLRRYKYTHAAVKYSNVFKFSALNSKGFITPNSRTLNSYDTY